MLDIVANFQVAWAFWYRFHFQRFAVMLNAKSLALASLVALMSFQCHGQELLVNGGFEAVDLMDWDGANDSGGAGSATIGAPGIGAQSGSSAVKLELFPGVGEVRQTLPASPGEVYNFQGFMLSEVQLPGNFETFGLLKIVFRDSNGTDLNVVDIQVGGQNPAFPGVESTPFLTDTNTPSTAWVFSEAQGTAPAGTVEVLFLVLNVDFGAELEAIWADNLTATVNGGSTNILANGDFEMELDGWTDPFSDPGASPFALGSPPQGVVEGVQAVESGAGNATLALSQAFPANPGDEYNLSCSMLSVFGQPAGDSFGLAKIVFQDETGTDLEPESVSLGQFAPPEFPGVESLPFLDSNISAGIWEFSEAQGIAPAGTSQVIFLTLILDFAGGTNPIWFDDATATLVSTTSCTFELGDIDQNGVVELLDIAPFVDLINNQGFLCEADINEDGAITLLDVAGFVSILSGN